MQCLQKITRWSFCHFIKDNILQIINNLDPNKAHGRDKISFRMLKDTLWFKKVFKKSTNSPPSLFRFKDVISKEPQSQYINFHAVTDVTNYGKNHLNVRSGHHLCILHLTGKRVECKPSAVSD